MSPRILIVRLSHLGDCVHALPVLHALRARYPSAQIAWAIQSEFASLVEGLPGLDSVLRFERQAGWAAYGRIWRELGSYAADWAIDAQGNGKSAAVLLASRAARRTGLAPEDWQEGFFSGVLTDAAPRARGPHALDRMRSLVETIAPASPWRSDVALSALELESARAWLDQRFPAQAKLRLVHLSRTQDIRAWPEALCQRWIELALAQGAHVLCVRGPAEASDFQALTQHFQAQPQVQHWVGAGDLRALAAVFQAAAERGARMVGPDSGPLHLAAAQGMPVLCLEGPQAEQRTGPRPGRALRHPQAPACAPCLARECRHASGAICMQIAPELVAQELERE